MYVDDSAHSESCETDALQHKQDMLKESEAVGVQLAPEKTEGPATKKKVLGVVIDTVRGTVGLPGDKLVHNLVLLRLIERLASIDGAALPSKFYEKLAGRLNWMSAVVPGSRYHMSVFYAAIHAANANKDGWMGPRWMINGAAEANWWFNRPSFTTALFRQCMYVPSLTTIAAAKSDASSEQGFGAVLGETAIYGRWSDRFKSMTPSTRDIELYALVVTVAHLSATGQRDGMIVHQTDNKSVVDAVLKNAGESVLSTALLQLLQQLCEQAALEVFPVFCARELNRAADAIAGACDLRDAELSVNVIVSEDGGFYDQHLCRLVKRITVGASPVLEWTGSNFRVHQCVAGGAGCDAGAHEHPIFL
jgi:hypothetical protein